MRVEEGLPQERLDALCVSSASLVERTQGEDWSTYHLCVRLKVNGPGNLRVKMAGSAPSAEIHLSSGSPAYMERVVRGGA